MRAFKQGRKGGVHSTMVEDSKWIRGSRGSFRSAAGVESG